MKILLFCGVIVFALFAYFQCNDGDQYAKSQVMLVLWVGAYLGTSISTLLALIGRPLSRSLHFYAGPFFLVLAVVHATRIDWSHHLIVCNEANPAANETGGLLLLMGWHLFMCFKGTGQKNPSI